MKILIALVAAIFSLSAFKDNGLVHNVENTSTVSNNLPLRNTRWKLVELGGKKIPANATSKQMYLILKSDSTITGNGGCNAFSGTYSTGKNNEIIFGEVVRTNILCPGIDFEKTYLDAIAKTDHYQIVGNELLLQNKLTSLAKFTGNDKQ
jgi:heat shock protein HslJ